MSETNNTFQNVFNQSTKLEKPITALRHYLDSIPEEDEHHSLLDLIAGKLEAEFTTLQQDVIKEMSRSSS